MRTVVTCGAVTLAALLASCSAGRTSSDAAPDTMGPFDANAGDASDTRDTSAALDAGDTVSPPGDALDAVSPPDDALDAGNARDVTSSPPDALAMDTADAADAAPDAPTAPLVFAVIGDYGVCGAYTATDAGTGYEITCADERDVARLVHSWHPAAVFTTGDNSYGSAQTYQIPGDQAPYLDIINAGNFFASMGNHDWFSPSRNTTSYLRMPGTHYVQSFGSLLRVFVLDTDPHEPDGDSATSVQARAFTTAAAASAANWNLSVNHEAPYSSCGEGSYDGQDAMHPDYRWVAAPGIDLVLSGHSHVYERLDEPNALGAGHVPHVIIGCSGAPLQGDCGVRLAGQRSVAYHVFGALRLTVSPTDLVAEFVDTAGTVHDRLALHHP